MFRPKTKNPDLEMDQDTRDIIKYLINTWPTAINENLHTSHLVWQLDSTSRITLKTTIHEFKFIKGFKVNARLVDEISMTQWASKEKTFKQSSQKEIYSLDDALNSVTSDIAESLMESVDDSDPKYSVLAIDYNTALYRELEKRVTEYLVYKDKLRMNPSLVSKIANKVRSS